MVMRIYLARQVTSSINDPLIQIYNHQTRTIYILFIIRAIKRMKMKIMSLPKVYFTLNTCENVMKNVDVQIY